MLGNSGVRWFFIVRIRKATMASVLSALENSLRVGHLTKPGLPNASLKAGY